MFQRLTSLFFSTPSPPEDPDCPRAFVSEEDEVDGWLIIDLPDSYAAPPSPGAASAPAGRPPPAPSLMDESWFVTPPACFTAEGPGLGPARLQSSPLEDLLIEHPSMSVYVTGSTIVLEPGPPSPLPDAALPDGDLSEGELAPAGREPRAARHVAPLPARAALLEKAGQVRRLQRARQRAERHALSAKAVQRQNRARESRPCRSKNQGSFIYQPCQRQFNY
ncbi:tumor protein p53-inducible nuclear protein 2 isoform X1 [Macaca nemestrina]|uniref:Tumor protein p53 inducible nuclear protein 2 n=1 Tax=Macaca nemestrina TaxID=9545 RepID=A0A2K6E7R8_MACNE|nr:tumor protein p53-inducible nuclear protein 2 isoform X1 [Macaca nemestrina]XP_011764755.1 tumor protein p53-inducible nuclear protein 2 isoform X1 [Macaca nemestrina]XP_011764756.1 tumor protein p53-inducible nuclear protein 2 isoform X1 [Macaca nemestrina]XP_011764757.1 tumor protein p53-inducible nuclear protein 2 isoform X1 [Macaca nemestrina]XP_011764758.1 tumor protein p53-inducible nuclear protein 2 isoform X1 [Macaca nemestrina]XP_024653198.1 tumor protein p53-inducible nuclear prot